MPRFMLKDKLYDAAAIEDLTLKDILRFEIETAELGRPMKWRDIEDLEAKAGEMGDEFREHPDALWLFGVTVLAVMRKAGEDVSFSDAIDIPLNQITMVPDEAPADEGEGESDPTDAGGEEQPARKASAPGAAPARKRATPSAAKATSARPSSTASSS